MSFGKATYLTAICDGCGPDWWESISDTPPLFLNRAAARKELADTFEWRMERQIDGSFRMLCPACAGKADCVKYGHDWVIADADAPEHLRGTPPTCHRCSEVRCDDAPPVGHPDSMSRELTDEEEWMLAALDAALFPEEAEC